MTSIDLDKFHQYKKEGLLKCQAHPTLPLYIFNYSETCQFSKKWDEVTLLARALITDHSGNIVARSFPKFFNMGERDDEQLTGEFVVQTKYDGSLAVIFYYDGKWRVASRGSFISDQAYKAQQLLDSKYNVNALDPELAYSAEIIYPENQIVVHYGQQEDLIFLAAFSKDGTEHFPDITKSGIPAVKVHDFKDFREIKQLDWSNSEGFVVRFDNGFRIKIKFENYLVLHRTLTNMSNLSIWEWYMSGKPLTEFIANVPDEFMGFVQQCWDDLADENAKILASTQETFAKLQDLDRKTFALKIKDDPYKRVLFAMLDKKPVFDMIAKLLKPTTTSKPFSGKVNRKPEKTVGQLTMMSGISGSGKSTWASQQAREQGDSVIVSRDKIRQMLYGYSAETVQNYYRHPMLNKREVNVTSVEMAMVRCQLLEGKHVIIDDTNLKVSTIHHFKKVFKPYQIHFQLCDTDTEEAIRRDASRPQPVGRQIIEEQAKRLTILKRSFDFSTHQPAHLDPLQQNAELPKCFIFDMDGTLAVHTSGRSPFDWDRVNEDSVNEPVRQLAAALKAAGYAIIICTGRDDVCKGATATWLEGNNIRFDELHARPFGDVRSDYIVKQEMWESITERYNITAMIDDRNQVVDHARALGFTVFQCAPGDF